MSNTQAETIATLLTEYTNYITTTPTTISNFQNAAGVLSTVFNTIMTTPDPASLTIVWNFFVINPSGVVDESMALPGSGSLNADARFKYLLIYSMFRQAANGLLLPTVDLMAGAVLNCPVLVTYLQDQSQTISTQLVLPNGATTGSVSQGTGIAFTTSGGTTTIALSPIPAETLLGNTGLVSGVPEPISLGTGLSISDGALTIPTPQWTAGSVEALGTGLTLVGGTLATTAQSSEWTAGAVASVVGGNISGGVLTITGGTPGAPGQVGPGFSGATINSAGHLIVTDTTIGGAVTGTTDLGNVVGTNGTNGINGTNGTPGATHFTALTDGPETITAQKFLQGNSAGTALQFYPGSLVENYTFNITFVGTDPSAITGTPAGWTITIPSQDVILIQHNLGIQPIQIFIWGLTSVADTWTQRTVGGNSLNMSYVDTNMNQCQINGVSTTSTAAAGLTARVTVFFAS